VLATSDELAAGVTAELASRKLTDVSVTGGGATVGGIQRILAGRQCMTVYEPVAPEARAAALFAAAIGRGVVPDLQGSVLIGQHRLPAIVSDPVEITNDVQLLNDTVIRDGAMTWEQVCTPAYERFCPPPSQRQGE
jgi:D-xylose transport system substrate-binding protein